MDNKLEIIRVAIYIRVSTEEQARHGYSLQSQKERLIDYAKQHNYKITDVYMDEGKSARCKLNNRKELLRLLDDVKLKRVDRIIFWRLDRWFRNVKDFYKVQDILDKYKVTWECSDEEYNTTTSNGRLHLNIKLSIAQNESDQTSDRIKFNFENMVKNGNAIQGSQCMPLGYVVAGERKNKKVIKDEKTKEIVEDMFNYFYNYESIRKTVKYINNKYGLTIRCKNFTGYLKNKLYTGEYRGIKNYCEAYISHDQFEEIQNKIKRNVKQSENRYEYIFSGLIKCDACNHSMAGNCCARGNYKYRNYRCSLAKNSHLCSNNKTISETKLEDYLLKNLKSELNKFMLDAENIEEKKDIKKRDIRPLEKKLERLNDLYLEDRIDKSKYESEYSKIKEQINIIKKDNVKKRNLKPYRELLKLNVINIYQQLNNESKRAFWGKYIDYIVKDNDESFVIHFK